MKKPLGTPIADKTDLPVEVIKPGDPGHWTLSEETLRDLREIEQNSYWARINSRHFCFD